MAEASGIAVLRTAYRAPKENAICERFLGSVRCECLDHVLVLGEAHLRRLLQDYVRYFNTERPHQGLGHRMPAARKDPRPSRRREGGCAPCRCWGDYTTRTGDWRKGSDAAARTSNPATTVVGAAPAGDRPGWFARLLRSSGTLDR